jgi:hypothetical protein
MPSPGPAARIKYIAPDGSFWQAGLLWVQRGLVRGSISAPGFSHYPAAADVPARQDAWIRYKAPDGRFWASRCQSYVVPVSLLISFKFDHWRRSAEDGPSDCSSEGLEFLDWAGQPWLARVNPMKSPGAPEFILERII